MKECFKTKEHFYGNYINTLIIKCTSNDDYCIQLWILHIGILDKCDQFVFAI